MCFVLRHVHFIVTSTDNYLLLMFTFHIHFNTLTFILLTVFRKYFSSIFMPVYKTKHTTQIPSTRKHLFLCVINCKFSVYIVCTVATCIKSNPKYLHFAFTFFWHKNRPFLTIMSNPVIFTFSEKLNPPIRKFVVRKVGIVYTQCSWQN